MPVGIDATVYEQSSEIREVGVGINTLPHAIRELADLGLLIALDAVAIRTRELHLHEPLRPGSLAREARPACRCMTCRNSRSIAAACRA
jgi:2-polyprenyl-6-methoxyphenol hydroxylase-like FAD-dependent oxidoreductase